MSKIQINQQTTNFSQIENAFKDTAKLDTGIRLKGNQLNNHSRLFSAEHTAKNDAKALLLRSIGNEYGNSVQNAVTDNMGLFGQGNNTKVTANDLQQIRGIINQELAQTAQQNFQTAKQDLPDQGVDVLTQQGGKVTTSLEGGGGVLFVENQQGGKVGVIKPCDTGEVQQTLQLQNFYESLLDGMDRELPFEFPAVKTLVGQDKTTVEQHIQTAMQQESNINGSQDNPLYTRLSGFDTGLQNNQLALMQMEFVQGTVIQDISIDNPVERQQGQQTVKNLGKAAPFCALFGLKDHVLASPFRQPNLENLKMSPEGKLKILDPDVLGMGGQTAGFSSQELRNAFQEIADLVSMGDQLSEVLLAKVQNPSANAFRGYPGNNSHEFAILGGFLQELNYTDLGNLPNEDKVALLTDFVRGMYEGMQDMAANADTISQSLDNVNQQAGQYALHQNGQGNPMGGDEFMQLFHNAFDAIDPRAARSI